MALLVRLSSPGPIFFRQTRVGLGGKNFSVYKFRTMRIDADQMKAKLAHLNERDGVLFKIKDDPRITRCGRILRKYSLDELAQLWNVFKGDMSLVGPRPPVPYEYERYQMWHRRRVLEMKPGITGLWQVEGRSRTTFEEMVRIDLRYAGCRSLWMDLRILLLTPGAVLSGRGAS